MSEASVMRKAGEFIGEVSLFEDGQAGAHWRTSVRALTPVRALLLTRDGIHHLLQTVPEAEAELRAGERPCPPHLLCPPLNDRDTLYVPTQQERHC